MTEEHRSTRVDIDLDSPEEELPEIVCLLEPAQALLRCLDEYGQVDMARIVQLTGLTPKETADALKGAVIRDPEGWNGDFLSGFELKDAYLSGNLSKKLSVAQDANEKYNGIFEENIKAIYAVLPTLGKRRTPHAALGAPWIPPHIIDDFIVCLLGNGTPHDDETIYDSVSGMWSIPYEKAYSDNVKNTNTYGTSYMPAVRIISKTLNAQVIEITKPQPSWNKGKETIDHEKTELVLEKQREINEIFSSWVYADPQRKEEIQKTYDAIFGTITGRRFDGSFFTFPDMSENITLRKNQRNAVARVIFSHNTLIAHDVGMGKTYTMIAAGHELRRMKISEKNMFVVPNCTLTQWEAAFAELYPKDKVLVVDSRNFGTKKRQKTLELIRDGDFDAILITASCFALIPMTRQHKIDMLTLERSELISVMNSDRKLVRAPISRKIDRLCEEIKKLRQEINELLYEGKKEGVCFDHLGIKTLFVDEAHEYKNITIKTRARVVGGVTKKGSAKCDGMLAKVRYTQQHGRGAVFATATPISNSISDVFVMQTYLQGGELKFLDLASFDNWAGTFAQREESLEVDVDSSTLRTVTRLSKFHNLPELSALFTQVADFYAESSEEDKNCTVYDLKVQCCDELRSYYGTLAERADLVRGGLVSRKEDNLLKITTDGRKAALDLRLIDGCHCSYKATKVFRCAEQVYEIWKRTEEKRLTQIVFCDLSVPKSGTFNVYDELRVCLLIKGVPMREVAFIHDAETEKEKRKLYEDMNSGKVRVLVGSTQKLGIGVNVQKRLCAVHHLDVPWKPSDITQREGRMLRQGNECEKTAVYRYVTTNSFDAVSWQILERKQDFIAQFMTNTLMPSAGVEFEEMALSFAEIKALAVGNPLVRSRIEAENELARMLSLQRAYLEQRRRAADELDALPESISLQRQHLRNLADDAAAVAAEGAIDKEERKALGEELTEALAGNVMHSAERLFSPFMGLDIFLPANMLSEEPRVILAGKKRYIIPMGTDSFGNVRRLENAANGIEGRAEEAYRILDGMTDRLQELIAEIQRPNDYAEKIQQIKGRIAYIDSQMKASTAS